MGHIQFFIPLLLIPLLFTLSVASGQPKEKEMVLLDVINDTVIEWEIDTKPEKYFMHYNNTSDDLDKTFLHTDIDLTPLFGAKGVWSFPHTNKFNMSFYAYFTKSYCETFFIRLEFRCYLSGDAELHVFNHSEATLPNAVFKSSVSTPKWETFTIDVNHTMNFRTEIHTKKTGDFGVLDKIVGYYIPPVMNKPKTHHTHFKVNHETGMVGGHVAGSAVDTNKKEEDTDLRSVVKVEVETSPPSAGTQNKGLVGFLVLKLAIVICKYL